MTVGKLRRASQIRAAIDVYRPMALRRVSSVGSGVRGDRPDRGAERVRDAGALRWEGLGNQQCPLTDPFLGEGSTKIDDRKKGTLIQPLH